LAPNPATEPDPAPIPTEAGVSTPDERAQLIAGLFREHNRALVSFLTARLHSLQDAKDVAQEAYVRLLQLDTPGALSFLRAYLFRIAQNLAIDRIRHQAMRVRAADTEALLFDDLDEASSPERIVVAQDELRRIGDRLQVLPAPCRRAFVMHVLLDHSVTDIAGEMGVTDRTIRNYVARGLALCQVARNEMDKK